LIDNCWVYAVMLYTLVCSSDNVEKQLKYFQIAISTLLTERHYERRSQEV